MTLLNYIILIVLIFSAALVPRYGLYLRKVAGRDTVKLWHYKNAIYGIIGLMIIYLIIGYIILMFGIR